MSLHELPVCQEISEIPADFCTSKGGPKEPENLLIVQ